MKKAHYVSLEGGVPAPISTGEREIIPQSRSIQLGGEGWGLVWNHPRGLLVREGREERLVPILDITRILQIGFYAASALLIAAGFIKLVSRTIGGNHGGSL